MRALLTATIVALSLGTSAMAQPVPPIVNGISSAPGIDQTAPKLGKPMSKMKTQPKSEPKVVGKTELGECSSPSVDQSRADCMMMQYNPGGAHYTPPKT